MRNILVTGASRGLGLSITSALVSSGYRVLAVARSQSSALTELANENSSGEVQFRAFDLANISGIGDLVGTLRRDFGPIYGLVNNAGIGTAGVLSMLRDEQLERIVRLNTLAPLTLTKYAVRSMMVERSGRIINMASIIASTGYSGLSAYAATKSAMIGFTRSLAREVGQLGITVNAIAPGFIDTEMTSELTSDQRDQIARRSALRRLAVPADVAAAVRYLLSEDARNITGTTLTIDAGNTA
jgi:3-oxoacyl-[acyl-carrier protein] reductase